MSSSKVYITSVFDVVKKRNCGEAEFLQAAEEVLDSHHPGRAGGPVQVQGRRPSEELEAHRGGLEEQGSVGSL